MIGIGSGWRIHLVMSLICIAAISAVIVDFKRDRGQPVRPVEFLGGSIEPAEVRSPQPVSISRKVKWFASCERVTNSREILDSERVVHKLDPDPIRPPRLADLPPDHIVDSAKPMLIPSGLPAGASRYRVTTCGLCPELSKEQICVVAPDLTFTVRGAESAAR